MITCVCNNVSETLLHRAIHEEGKTLEQLQSELLVGTKCGKCIEYVKQYIRERDYKTNLE